MEIQKSQTHVKCLVIGQGICGTFLSWQLHKSGISFIVIDESRNDTASKAAAGIINPVTGRRIVKTWMIDEIIPYVLESYSLIGQDLGICCIEQKNIIDFFATPQMRSAFLERYAVDQQYLRKPADENKWNAHFNYDFGYGEIQPCYLADLSLLISSWRSKLIVEKAIREEKFDIDDLKVTDQQVQYREISADRVIFCDGIESSHNRFFKYLPFAPNKGEALIIEARDLPTDRIFKKGLILVPWKKDLFWIGSSYQWEFQDSQPSEFFRTRTEIQLLQWLKMPFKIIDHLASVRPATLERRPFVGFHPVYRNVGILNGMGTKGCSLAPFFANQLSEHIANGKPLSGEADVQRFARILEKTASK